MVLVIEILMLLTFGFAALLAISFVQIIQGR
jgi:hypothetical protein